MTETKIGPCQCCGEVTKLFCGPSRFGDETWACDECWNPVSDHERARDAALDSIGWFG